MPASDPASEKPLHGYRNPYFRPVRRLVNKKTRALDPL